MKLSELLATISSLAKEYGISQPYMVGGLPRDQLLGRTGRISDIDITVGDSGSAQLAMIVSKAFPNAYFDYYDDGHASLQFKNIKMDFSNNFNIPGITKLLENIGIKNPTSMQKEVYSRDLTINTILLPFDLSGRPIDITGQGLNDLNDKILRSPIDPNLTIGHDPRRILRVLKLSMKLDFEIDRNLKDAIIKYRGSLKDIPDDTIKRKMNSMLEIDVKKTINLLSEFKLLPIIPLSKLMTKEITKNRMIDKLLGDK